MRLEELKKKSVLILGFQNEGVDSFNFLREKFPDKILGVADQLDPGELTLEEAREIIESDKKIRPHLGKEYLESISRYQIILKSPGIPPRKVYPLLSREQKVTSQTEIFFENHKGKIVGITGSLGKSTASSVIFKVLKQGREKTYLMGNIGKPALSLLSKSKRDDIFVYELSSHQLLNLKESPHIAVLLNIFKEHLDYYKDFNEYKKAKENITRYQTRKDFLVFNSQNEIVRKIAEGSKAQRISFSLKGKSDCFLKNDWIFYKNRESKKTEKIIRLEEIPLRGKFNLQNVMPAIIVGKIFKVPRKAIVEAIKNFKPLPHRLEFIGKYKGIRFYNDSLSTIPEATIAAIQTLKDTQTILLGGFDRKQDFTSLADKILESGIKNIILFPPTGERIRREILRVGERNPHFRKRDVSFLSTKDMKKAVQWAFQNTDSEKIVLLSPAAPSFGLFENYKQRGDLFSKWVKQLGENEE